MKIQDWIYTQSCTHVSELSLMKRGNKEQVRDQCYDLDLQTHKQGK